MADPRRAPDKPPLMLAQQVERLRERGMDIADGDRASHYLGHLNYYRLRGYWMHFELPDGNGGHSFRAGTRFDDVIHLYDFDRRLRLELNDAIERIEVSLRTRWAYVLAHLADGGPIAHRNAALFNDHHAALLASVERIYADRNELFLARYLVRGEEPPVWALCETLSLGELSKWLRSIRAHPVRQQVADPYDLHETPFCSFVEHLAYVRNLCAHHGRTWNRPLLVGTLALPKRPAALRAQLQWSEPARLRIYNTLAMLAWIMRRVSPGSEWSRRIRALIEERPDLWGEMGFPAHWQNFELWTVDPAREETE
ncbi:MAG: Abi family protein [Pseudomonas sp.]|nr:Abi family protein [Xanthomonadaceae bacterium]MDZ4115916.1 Abi family protein [Xanthomonadaceae bacterium]MDZ4326047.1 Abi family protein [Pseudomonas sp.]